MKRKLLFVLFTVVNLVVYGQWNYPSSTEINTYDKVKIYNSLYVGSQGLEVYSSVKSGNFIDRDNENYFCNPSNQSAFYSFRVQQKLSGVYTTKFSVDNDGTTHVNATLYAKDIYVQSNVWPDFVFKKEYRLRTLSEIEQYIQQNNHLPGIPAEEEISQGGINLSEMNVLLLQKIEELTLYTINQQKEIDRLKQQYEELTKLGN